MPRIDISDRNLALAASLLALLLAASGCVSRVGDSCTEDSDCPQEAICDSTAPDGYCTIPECSRGSCPGNSICVPFEDSNTYCMKPCEDASDCRDDYVCRNESYSRPFCFVDST